VSKQHQNPKRTEELVGRRDNSSSPQSAGPGEVTENPLSRPTDQPSAVQVGADFNIQVTTASAFSGPLPHPTLFQAYEHTLPGAANRILEMAEKQQIHRHFQASQRLMLDGTRERRGQWMGFLIAVSAIVGGVTLIWLDKPILGFTTLFGAIASVVSLFVWSRRPRSSILSSDSPQSSTQPSDLPAPPG